MAAQTAHEGNEAHSFGHGAFRRISDQRAQRYLDPGPELGALGAARYRLESDRLLIAYAQIPPASLHEAIGRVDRFVQARDLRAIWTIMSESIAPPSPLERALIAHDYRLEERLILMARQGTLTARPNPSVTITPITTFSAMRTYEHGSRRAFYNDPTPDESVVAARAGERLRQQDSGWFRYYAASLDATIVGGLYVSLWEDVPTIMGVYTHDSAQRRGAATAAIQRAIDDLGRSGHDTYCLFVKDGNPAERLYAELGFRRLGAESSYLLAT